MTITKLLVLSVLFLSWSPYLTASSGRYIGVNPKKSYLDFDLSKGIAGLSFYSSSKFQGKPKVEMGEQGLLVDNKLVCSWPNRKFNSKESYNMVLQSLASREKSEAVPCREGGSIISTWGDNGNGTAVLYVEVEQLNEEIAQINFQQSKVFLNLKSLQGRFSVRKPGEI